METKISELDPKEATKKLTRDAFEGKSPEECDITMLELMLLINMGYEQAMADPRANPEHIKNTIRLYVEVEEEVYNEMKAKVSTKH